MTENPEDDAPAPTSPPEEEEKGAKLFVGGLSWDTTDDGFLAFFKQFGDVSDAIVMRDKVTGTSRGFGFVTYRKASAAERVLKESLELDGRKLDPKKAVPKGQTRDDRLGVVVPRRTSKIFVGGLNIDTTDEEFRQYFEQFGVVKECQIMTDRITGRSRGFGFITFDTEDAVEKACENPQHELGGRMVECKKAIPRSESTPSRDRPGYGHPPRERYPPRPPSRGRDYDPYYDRDYHYGGGYRYDDRGYPPRDPYYRDPYRREPVYDTYESGYRPRGPPPAPYGGGYYPPPPAPYYDPNQAMPGAAPAPVPDSFGYNAPGANPVMDGGAPPAGYGAAYRPRGDHAYRPY